MMTTDLVPVPGVGSEVLTVARSAHVAVVTMRRPERRNAVDERIARGLEAMVRVNAFPDKPGEWQVVDAFPDFTVQIVDAFPDFTVQYVDAFPGCS